jgi:hypothetical protein
VEGHRDGPLAARGSCCDPMALLVAGRAVCGSAAARLANMGSVDDPASCRQLCMRTNAPSRDGRKPHEARRRTGPDPSEAGHDPGGARETSPGSWPGPSCDSSPLRGPIASPMGWTVTPLPATGQPKPASYPAAATSKQANGPGRGSDRGRPRPLAPCTRRSVLGASRVTSVQKAPNPRTWLPTWPSTGPPP